MPGKLTKIPDEQPPIRLGDESGTFVLTATGVEVEGRPNKRTYVGAFQFAKRAHQSSGFWMADLLRYGKTRPEWREALSQMQDATGLTEKRLKNIRAVGAIDISRRRDGVDFGLHEVVAGMEPEDQTKWLTRAEEEGWDRREMRDAIKHSRRRKVLDGRADTMHTIELAVQIEHEAQTPGLAEKETWDELKALLSEHYGKRAKVISSHARPK